MVWISLFIAGLFEIGWAIGLKCTNGFSKLWPSVWTVAAMIVSLVFPEYAMRTLPVGTAYAIWVGIGAVGPRSWACGCSTSRAISRGSFVCF